MDDNYIKAFRESIRVFEREIFLQNTESCCEGVSLAQCHTLVEIQKKDKISVTDLAENMQLDKSTVSRTVDKLVKMDLVDRSIPEENRRMAFLKLTGEGQEVCKSINFSSDAYIAQVLDNFSENERADFLKLFRKLTHNMLGIKKAASREKQL